MLRKPIVYDVREYFIEQLRQERFVTDKTGVKTIELVGASFEADEDYIFGEPNHEYIQKELSWYESMSLNVYDMEDPPEIWKRVADENGFINSNYGWVAWSVENYRQYENVLKELRQNPDSRRGVMIYNRPSMWIDYNKDGRSDFMCTNAVTYHIRDDRLHCTVQMRSNDAWAGYRNDLSWQRHVLEKLATDLDVGVGSITWQVGSLHVYEKQFWMVDCWGRFRRNMKKAEYEGLVRHAP